jgi:soluble lytic murein transglycosylase
MIPILGKKRCAIFTTILLLASSLPAAADIYMYRDRHGVLHFTNAPAKPGYRLFLSTPKPGIGRRSPTDRFDQLITDAARTHGLEVPLLKAIIKVESDFNPQAVSRAGAQGLMQIMPETADLLEIKEPFDPLENIMGGTRYLKTLLERFAGNLPLALAAYNAGPTTVEKFNGIPPYPETENYVEKVIKYQKLFKD